MRNFKVYMVITGATLYTMTILSSVKQQIKSKDFLSLQCQKVGIKKINFWNVSVHLVCRGLPIKLIERTCNYSQVKPTDYCQVT